MNGHCHDADSLLSLKYGHICGDIKIAFPKMILAKLSEGLGRPLVLIAQSAGLNDLWTKIIRLPCEFLMTEIKWKQENRPINLNHQIQILNRQ
jgi:hypothetical protein